MIDEEIKNLKKCNGCYACFNVCPYNCISMEEDIEGFWYPSVDYNNCHNCGLCIKACPILHKITMLQEEPTAYAAYNTDENIRMESSSGGIFTLIAEAIINKGGVVFGASFDENFNVIHSYADNKKDLQKFRGSKYVQSRIGYAYKTAESFLKSGREVLFTGTPCQIAGLKAYLGVAYENLTCQDIICHGVPSPKVWKKYLEYKEKEAQSKSININFRNKRKGWRLFSLSILFENGLEYCGSISSDLYLVGFNKNLFLRPSCYCCYFKTVKRQSDFTLADFWGIHDVVPELNNDKGTSLLFIQTQKGNHFLNELKSRIVLLKLSNKHAAIEHNRAMISSMKMNPKREIFFKNISKRNIITILSKYCKDKLILRIRKSIILSLRKSLIKLGARRIKIYIQNIIRKH